MIHNGLLCSGSSSCTPYNWRPTWAKNELVTISFTPLSNRLTTLDIYLDNFSNLFELKDPLPQGAATQFVFCFHGETLLQSLLKYHEHYFMWGEKRKHCSWRSTAHHPRYLQWKSTIYCITTQRPSWSTPTWRNVLLDRIQCEQW